MRSYVHIEKIGGKLIQCYLGKGSMIEWALPNDRKGHGYIEEFS